MWVCSSRRRRRRCEEGVMRHKGEGCVNVKKGFYGRVELEEKRGQEGYKMTGLDHPHELHITSADGLTTHGVI